LTALVLLGIFVAVELSLNNRNSSNIAAVFATIALAIFLIAFLVETVLSIK
jgi:steroid 5-alpha reductase family enzyme